jgi:hypothetical protein
LFEYHALVLKMHQDVDNNTQVAYNLELFCDLEVMMGFYIILPILEGLNDFIKFSQSRQCFIYDFVAIVKLCQTCFYY